MMKIIIYGFIPLFFISIVRGENIKTSNESSDVVIEQLAGRFRLAEGPHWNPETQQLYFVDILAQKLCKLDPATGVVTSTYIENGPVGVAVPVADTPDTFVAGAGTDFVLIKWTDFLNNAKPNVEVLATVDTDRNGTRWNDGKVDSSGRFWGGTMGAEKNGVVEENQGSLYRITGDGVVKKMVSPVTISNGLAWSRNDDIFYYIDSMTYQVAAFDFDSSNGTISNRRVVFDLKKNNVTGIPDGMTIDSDGNLWVALYTGHGVIQVNPQTGELLRTIRMPADRITSVAFGGPLFDVLYVTSASTGLDEKQLAAEPLAGYVFAVKGLGVHGLPANKFKLSK